MNRFAKQLLPFCSLVFLISLLSAIDPHNFLTTENFLNVLRRSSVNGIMAAGMTFIIITAGIDLSVGSMLALCGMAGATGMLFLGGGSWEQISTGTYVPLGVGAMLGGTLVGVLAGALCGFLNGTVITRLKLPPFIVTLGTMSVFRGFTYLMNDGKPLAVSDYDWLDVGTILGIPSSVVLFALVLALAGFVLHHTRLGRYTYATGSNAETAFHAGVRIDKVLIIIYTAAGALVGLAAMVATARASSSQPSAGISLELDVIAAVIIGGCSPSGGRGTIVGTLIGTLLISFLRNGCTLLGLSTNVQLVVIGAVVILAVAADRMALGQQKTRAATP